MKEAFRINSAIVALMVFILMSGCGSNEEDMNPDDINNSGFFLKAKVNGALVEFKQEELQLVNVGSAIPGVYEISISAGASLSDESGYSEAITLIVRDDSPIGVKTYDYLRPFTETGFGLKGFILGYLNASEGLGYVTDVDEEDSILQITELTNTRIKGKFSGIIYDIVSGNSKNITEGEFFLKVDNMN
ncbi:hypothetical protein [Shivajiella indica]|uniref:Uncharacterized protein n=1 Tax=Shivajiella indica TaxID=872115 RepID=A0ABW5BB42_9BACT